MADTAGLPAPAPSRAAGAALVLAGGGFALLVGLAAGFPAREVFVALGAVTGTAILAGALVRPAVAFRALAASTIFLVVVDVLPGRGLNLFDLLVPVLLLATLATGARGRMLGERARWIALPEAGAAHARIAAAADALARAALLFYGVALLSLGVLLGAGRAGQAVDSLFSLVRAAQGLLLFPLGLWWLRGERDVRATMSAMLAGGALFAVVNLVALFAGGAKRAGLVWFVAEPFPSLGSPNEAATAMLVLVVLLLVRQSLRRQARNPVLIAGALALMVLTFSRGGLLALVAFALVTLPRMRWTWLAGGALVVAAVLPVVPGSYWERVGRTLLQERGTFESFTTMIRVFAWDASWRVFLDHPLLGVGYLGFSGVSHRYNELRLVLGPAENYFLEIAAGMGIAGLAALAFVMVRLFRLGGAVARATLPGTLGHGMARLHTPLLIALFVPSLVGDNFVGMVGIGQLALWCAMLVRAGHEGAGAARS